MRAGRGSDGFSLVEMIVVVFLLALAMLGILAVFDASARINKSEQQVADAQGAVRYGIYQMTRAIRMAGAGGLFITQAVLNQPDTDLGGITLTAGTYNNVAGTVLSPSTVTNLAGVLVPIRPGTDMIEIRGVINSPLLGFDPGTGCAGGAGCTLVAALDVAPISGSALVGQHVNDNSASRPQFAAINAYTASAATNPMFVLVAADDDVHGGCSSFSLSSPTDPTPIPKYPQTTYNVGLLSAQTTLVPCATLPPPTCPNSTFGSLDFSNAMAKEFNNENPTLGGTAAQSITRVYRAGVLDDLLYFIDNSDPQHPVLAQGTRRFDTGTGKTRFDIVPLADDVEDMQIAYGIDANNNDAVNRIAATTVTDPDQNVSTAIDGDEWSPNVSGETAPSFIKFQCTNPTLVAPFCDPIAVSDPFSHGGAAPAHCPRLHAVMISLVARSKDSDPTYKGPTATGYKVMDSTQVAPPGQYRRRVQTMKINLRNYSSGT